METSEGVNVPEGYTVVSVHDAYNITTEMHRLGVEGVRTDEQRACQGCPDLFCRSGTGNCPVGGDLALIKTELLLKGKLLGLQI